MPRETPDLDWLGSSFADMLSTDIGQSAQLRTVSPSNLHQILTDLRISSATELDPSAIHRVADFSNAQRVIWGQYAKFGDQIRIDATLQDFKNDSSIPLKIDIPNEKEIPGAIDKLAESIREKLALPSNVLKELKASSFQPESASIEALRAYNLGVGFQRDGRNLEAQQQLETAARQIRISRSPFPVSRRPTASWAMTIRQNKRRKRQSRLARTCLKRRST